MQVTKLTDKWLFDVEEQWSQFFQYCNWYTFDFFHFQIEHDTLMGSVGMSIYVLGLGINISWAYKVTEAAEEIARRAKEISDDAGL